MKNKPLQLLAVLCTITVVSCETIKPGTAKLNCGYPLTKQEYNDLRIKCQEQLSSVYEADSLWSIYDQMNDSIRLAMPDTIEFEVFLSLLNDAEVGIDVFVPKNQSYFEKIACTVMNKNYKGKMPDQRFLCVYSYTNDDGSGDSPLEFSIKRIK